MSRNTAVLDQLRGDRDEARTAALALMEAPDYDPGSDALKGLEERAASLDGQIARLVTLHEQQDAADALDGRLGRAAQRQNRDANRDVEHRSIGEQFIESDVWRNYNLNGNSGKFEIQHRALPHSLASMADALPSAPITDLTPPATPDVLIPLTNVITVSTNAIDYIVWALKTGAAAIVPEGGSKPELEWEPNVTSSSLDTIAGRTSFTRQLAEDASAVRDFINGELQREVSRKVEAEAKDALAAATLPTVTGPAGAGVTGAIRAGKAAVQAAGYNANGFLVSSDDLVDIDIASMSMFRGDAYWGLTPIVDPGMDAGDPVIVGDFKAGVQHYRRNSVVLYVTDSHGTHWAENVLDALAEQRCLTVVTKPAALVEASAGA